MDRFKVPNRPLRLDEVHKLTNLSISTIRRRIDDGALEKIQAQKGKALRVTPESVRKFLCPKSD